MKISSVEVVSIVFAGVLVLTGCSATDDPRIAENRQKFLLSNQPAEISSIEDAKKMVSADKARVVIRGQADLEALQPAGQQKALMLIREIQPGDHGQDAGHDPSSCPFCKRRLEAAPKAAVEFAGLDGKTLPYSVGTMFQINQGDQVVVAGTAEFDESLDILKIRADGVYRFSGR